MTDPKSCPKPLGRVFTLANIAPQPKPPEPKPPEPDPVEVDFRKVFEGEFDYVLRSLRYLGVAPRDLEDVAHDVFLHVFRHLGDYDRTRPLRPWLYGFAFRIAKDFRQLARHRETATDDFTRTLDPKPGPEDLVLRQQRQALALAGLEALDTDERGVFVALSIDELNAPEAAEALRVPLNTVYSRLRRARTKFEAEVRRLSAREKQP